MGALLALIPIKDWIYGGVILALIASFALYTHHERTIGADEALAPVAVLAQKAKIQVATANAVAQTTEKDNAQTFAAAVAAPAPPALGIVCHDASGSGDVPEADTVPASGAGEHPADGGAAATFDPSGPALKLGADTDAQIIYLQARIKELEAQMTASP